MYATVIQSQTAEGSIRQTAVAVRTASGDIVTYSRIAGGRGRAGAWSDIDPDDILGDAAIAAEQVLGLPSSVKITDTDEEAMAGDKPKPTVLWQKLARVAQTEEYPTNQSLGDTYTRLLDEANRDPRALATYLGGTSSAPTSVVMAAKMGAGDYTVAAQTDNGPVVIAEVEHHAIDSYEVTDDGDIVPSVDDDEADDDSLEALAEGHEVRVTVHGGMVSYTLDGQPSYIESVLPSYDSLEEMTEVLLRVRTSKREAERKAREAAAAAEAERIAAEQAAAAEAEAAAADFDARLAAITEQPQVADAEEPLLMTPTVIGAGGHVPQKSELAPLLIPSLADVEGYVERTLPGGKSEHEVFDFARAHGHAVAIFGHSGTGKTSSARNYAAMRQLPFVPFECNPQTDEEVVQGTYIPTGNGTELAWRYSQLATAIQQPSVILLNESNRMSAKANALFLHLLQERELIVSRHKNEVIPVHPEVLFITDANPGYQGTTKHDQAFLDRFAITLEYNYDREVEKHFIPSSHLLDLATQLREQAEREERYRDTPVSTRLLINFVEHAKGLGMEFARASFLASFSPDERDALVMVMDVYTAKIAEDLGLGTADDEQEELDEDEFSFENDDADTFAF
jgi:hypothetical protein